MQTYFLKNNILTIAVLCWAGMDMSAANRKRKAKQGELKENHELGKRKTQGELKTNEELGKRNMRQNALMERLGRFLLPDLCRIAVRYLELRRKTLPCLSFVLILFMLSVRFSENVWDGATQWSNPWVQMSGDRLTAVPTKEVARKDLDPFVGICGRWSLDELMGYASVPIRWKISFENFDRPICVGILYKEVQYAPIWVDECDYRLRASFYLELTDGEILTSHGRKPREHHLIPPRTKIATHAVFAFEYQASNLRIWLNDSLIGTFNDPSLGASHPLAAVFRRDEAGYVNLESPLAYDIQ